MQISAYLYGEYKGHTEVMGGMSRPGVFKRWVEKLRERGQFAEYLSCVEKDELSSENRVDLGLSSAFASAIPGSVRFIDPRNSYRMIGNAATVAYPCFMRKNEDLETLKAEGLKSREEIRKVYQNLVQLLRAPTRQNNSGGDKSFWFSTLTRMRAGSAIEETLLSELR